MLAKSNPHLHDTQSNIILEDRVSLTSFFCFCPQSGSADDYQIICLTLNLGTVNTSFVTISFTKYGVAICDQPSSSIQMYNTHFKKYIHVYTSGIGC